MLLIDLLDVMYEDTRVEVQHSFEPVFIGTAKEAKVTKFYNCRVVEVYINFDGSAVVISITNKPRKKRGSATKK